MADFHLAGADVTYDDSNVSTTFCEYRGNCFPTKAFHSLVAQWLQNFAISTSSEAWANCCEFLSILRP